MFELRIEFGPEAGVEAISTHMESMGAVREFMRDLEECHPGVEPTLFSVRRMI